MLRLDLKQIHDGGPRGLGECHEATPVGEQGLAYLRLTDDGRGEQLVYRATPATEPVLLTERTVAFSPCAAGKLLFWVECLHDRWALRAVPIAAPKPERIFEPFGALDGRPLFLSACHTDDGSWLAWEQRRGTATVLRTAFVRGDRVSAPHWLDTKGENAYEPMCAVDGAGRLYVVYCAFCRGNYAIFAQPCDARGAPAGERQRLSDRIAPCLYPSAHGRAEGGIWFSFTAIEVDAGRNEMPYVRHARRRDQLAMFRSRGVVYAGMLDGEALYAPLLAGSPDQCATMRVHTSVGAGHSRILEDRAGRLHLLLRQHVNEDELTALDGAAEAVRPLRSSKRGTEKALHSHAHLCAMTLDGCDWRHLGSVVPRAYLDVPIQLVHTGDGWRTSFTEDGRHTGWNESGERFDAEGELAVGAVTLKPAPDPDASPPELIPFRRAHASAPAIEEPAHRQNATDGPRWAFGQTHTHSSLSVCARELDREPHTNYRFMQDVQHCDFGGLTDHDYNTARIEQVIARKLASYYHSPGTFVALPAYEWTGSGQACHHHGGPFGHINPLWFGDTEDGLPVHSPCDPDDPGCTPRKLWQVCAGQPVLTPPHHVVDAAHPFNWSHFDETGHTPIVEIFQEYRGSGEHPDAPGVTNYLHRDHRGWIVQQLNDGRRFGFIGGADHMGTSRAGVWVAQLTREALYESLRARHCLATTGIALNLQFHVNDRPMGAAVSAEQARFSVRISAPMAIECVQMLRNGEIHEQWLVNGVCFEHAWDVRRKAPGEFWYARVLLANGEIVWSSPIWLDA